VPTPVQLLLLLLLLLLDALQAPLSLLSSPGTNCCIMGCAFVTASCSFATNWPSLCTCK
jgi:hypothetical protein